VGTVGNGLLLLLALLLVVGLLVRWLGQQAGADWGGRWLNGLDGLNRVFCRRYHRLSCEPLPLPAEGPALVVANHLSGLDPLLLLAASPRPLRFIIAKEQYHRFGLTWLFRAVGCIPVDRGGRPERAFREALKALKAGEAVALFPQGAIHLPGDPERPLRPGVARMAQLAGAPICAVQLSGIRGEGRVLGAVLLRSQARLHASALIQCRELALATCLQRVADAIGHPTGEGDTHP